jgi:hypothetical protein
MSPISETARERHLGAQVSSDLSRIHRDFAPDDPRWRCGEDKTGCRQVPRTNHQLPPGPATRMKSSLSLGAYPACDFRADTDDSGRRSP